MLKSIEAFAVKSPNPKSIYNAAAIPLPKTPQELDTPPPPANVLATVTNLGGVKLTWKVPSKNAYRGGTYFIVERAMSRISEPPGAFTLIGQPADREFIDETIPPSFDKATYRVFATRNNKTSDVTEVVVNFGVLGQTPLTSGQFNAEQSNLSEAA